MGTCGKNLLVVIVILIAAAGAVVGIPRDGFKDVEALVDGSLRGSEYVISDAGGIESYPAVAYDSVNKRFLVSSWVSARLLQGI